MREIQALYDLIGPFALDVAAIATLTGIHAAQVAAHIRLGHLVVVDGQVVSVKRT